MIYAAETTHSNRERKLVQPLEGSPERLRHHLRRPHQRRTTLLIVDRTMATSTWSTMQQNTACFDSSPNQPSPGL
jgi:hypothetical protein